MSLCRKKNHQVICIPQNSCHHDLRLDEDWIGKVKMCTSCSSSSCSWSVAMVLEDCLVDMYMLMLLLRKKIKLYRHHIIITHSLSTTTTITTTKQTYFSLYFPLSSLFPFFVGESSKNGFIRGIVTFGSALL